MEETNKIFSNSKEVSKLLSISIRTLQKLSQEGKIRAIKIGRLWRYKRSDIEIYVSSGTDFSKEPARKPNNLSDRRTFPRINCSIPCDIVVIIPQKKEVYSKARILNISEGGIFLENYEKENGFLNIGNDDPINLKFELNESAMLEVNGRVLRIQDKGIAVKFKRTNFETKELIREYIG